jgi:hypothetical protein
MFPAFRYEIRRIRRRDPLILSFQECNHDFIQDGLLGRQTKDHSRPYIEYFNRFREGRVYRLQYPGIDDDLNHVFGGNLAGAFQFP